MYKYRQVVLDPDKLEEHQEILDEISAALRQSLKEAGYTTISIEIQDFNFVLGERYGIGYRVLAKGEGNEDIDLHGKG